MHHGKKKRCTTSLRGDPFDRVFGGARLSTMTRAHIDDCTVAEYSEAMLLG
jgi:hypothetical protein